MLLQIRKYTGLVAVNTYKECKENALKHNFDLIIIDIHLSEVKVAEKVKHIRDIVNVPIIAYVDYYYDFRSKKHKVIAYLMINHCKSIFHNFYF